MFGGTLPEEIDKKYKRLAETIQNGEGANAIKGALNDLKLSFIDFADDAGMNIDLSLGYSIDKNGHFVYTALENVSDKGEATYKKKNEMASPSKLYKRLGTYIPEGIALGIEDGIDTVDDSMADLTNSVQAQFKDYRWNIPSLDLGNRGRNTYSNATQYSGGNNALYEQMLNNGTLNSTTEVVFRVEGDPYNIFRVVRDQNNQYRNRTHRSAFT